MRKYIYVIYGLIGGLLWGIYTLFINRYYQTTIFTTYWHIDNLKELFSEAIVNNIICVLASFGFGLFIWTFMWKKKAKDFIIRNKKHIFIVIINGLLSGTAATVLYHLAVQFSGEVYASAVKTLYIPLSSIYSWMVFKNANWKSVTGVILATTSIIWIGFLDSDTEHVRSIIVGLIAASLVGVCWTAEAIFTAKVLHNDDTEEELAASVFISYRQLVSLLGVIVAAYVLYPLLSHTSLVDSKLNEYLFRWDWVYKIITDWHTIGWLVLGSAFNSISDFYYYWSYKGLAIPTATTMNNLDTPFGFIYTLIIIAFGWTTFFGTQSVPSIFGIVLVFTLLIGSILVILFDNNDFMNDENSNSKRINPNKVFWRYFTSLSIIFVICTYLAHGPGVNINEWKQKDAWDSTVEYSTVKKYDNTLSKKEIQEVLKEIDSEK